MLTVPTMSSSSHKRHRSSQQDIRKAYASRGTVDRHASEAKQESSVHIAGMESLASSRTNVSDGQSDAVQPTPVPPFITPHAKATVDSHSTMVSTMVPTAGTSDLSTTSSNASAPPPRPRPEPTPHPSNQSNESNPSTNNRAQPLFIDLWHNRDSVGQIQFGTQSSPQKALKLLAAMERTVPAEASNGEDPSPSPPDTITAAAPTLRLTKVPTTTAPPKKAPPKKGPPKDPPPAASSTNQDQQYPNLFKGKVTKVREGSYLVPLRRVPPLPCKNPGPAASANTPLVLITPTLEASKKSSLTLVANYCSGMMRRAKNYTAGVSRSPTGTSKQRRFTNKTTNKRKHAESSDTTQQTPESNNASTTPIQLVTSFALRTLLLEDIWFLKEGLPVLLFFHEESLPPRYSKKWLSIWRATLQSDFVPTVVCQGRPYKQLTGWVHANGDINRLTDANLTVPYKTIFAAMGEATQNTIRLKFPIMSPSSSNFVAPPTTDCLEEKLSWFEAFHFPQSVFLQADYHPERPWNATFKSVKDDSDDRLTLLHRLVQETPGDRFMLAELRSVWERFDTKTVLKNARDAMVQELNEKVKEATLRASKLYSPIIVKDVVEPFCKWVDTTLLQRIEDCFGRFNNIFEMFLSKYELRQIVSQFEKSLPNQFEAIMGYSGYTKKLESAAAEDREFLSLRYSLDTFFQFVVRARNHNNHLLVPFATVFAFAQYACGHSLMATQIPVWFGISVSKRTVERRVETWVDSYDARVRRSLRKVTFLMAVFDNLQDGRLLQFQQGQSAIYTRVTARFIMQMYSAKFPQSNAFLSDRPKLAYIEQDIPSPYQMPPFEVFQQSS